MAPKSSVTVSTVAVQNLSTGCYEVMDQDSHCFLGADYSARNAHTRVLSSLEPSASKV